MFRFRAVPYKRVSVLEDYVFQTCVLLLLDDWSGLLDGLLDGMLDGLLVLRLRSSRVLH